MREKVYREFRESEENTSTFTFVRLCWQRDGMEWMGFTRYLDRKREQSTYRFQGSWA